MDMGSHDTPEQDHVKKIVVKAYKHHEAGLDLVLKNMSLYLLNEEDFGINPDQFDPEEHEHSIPKYEMARIYLLVCALTHDDLGFTPEDRDDPVFHIYEKAYHRCLEQATEPELLTRLDQIAQACGFVRPHA
ncbi:MAG TPA: hypothetical protein VE954_00165 [Oligoflexus sp.]|uniref:hypothetical protein n=1 Tax=Oligoflexus sp. TaxID=1971216 RepID=UPI002D53B26F|nr:hypothetical protein [Oligoflexus sp.]HYX31491.1 hypothetical protein [Oligoflexus sp.]